MASDRPPLTLTPPPAPAPRGGAHGLAEAKPPRLRRRTRALVGRIGAASPDQDLHLHWPASLVAMVEVVEATLGQCPSADPRTCARAVVAALADYLGGSVIYLPGPAAIERALRDHAIWRAFDGRNASELAERHKMPLRTVYHVLQQQRRLRQQARARRLGRV